MAEYYRLLLGRSAPQNLSPRDAKRALAKELVSWLHSPAQAALAEEGFDKIFVEHGTPQDIEELTLEQGDGMAHMPAVMALAFGVSRSEARRLIEQGAVELAGEPLAADAYDIPVQRLDGEVLKVGKRRFVRLRVT
jgi:tyrosyl-tRNA synthetase